MHSIQFTNSSLRIFKKLPKDVQKEIKKHLEILKVNPLSGEPLKGLYRGFRSLHLSYKGVSYRVIYQFYSKLETVVIFLADKRENIYKRLEEMRI